MCGIVGLYLKNPKLQPQLGAMFKPMIIEMTNRGPDSAGVAVYRNPVKANELKFSLAHDDASYNWKHIDAGIEEALKCDARIEQIGNHCILVTTAKEDDVVQWLKKNAPGVRVVGSGHTIEIFKETGLPENVYEKFDLASASGTHIIGHTRMATDENDTEVAAAYMTWKIRNGASLKEALQDGLKDLDGFYTFLVGTADGFAVVRDPIACKHAVMAETDDWVAMATEYRAIAHLPGADDAKIWEPEPTTIYTWGGNA